MKWLYVLLVLLPILMSIVETASTSKNDNKKTSVNYRNPKRLSFRALPALLDDDDNENENEELDDEEDDDDDDDDDYVESDDDVLSNNFEGVRFPQFHELFDNPDGRPAGPNSYEAYLKHIPKQPQSQPQQDNRQSRPPPSPVRRVESGPIYQDDDVPPSRKKKGPPKRKSRPPVYRDGPPPSYQNDGPPPSYQNDGPPPSYQNDGPPPSYQNDESPPPRGGPVYHDRHHPSYNQGPSYQNGPYQNGPPPSYPQVHEVPQGGEATPIFEFPSLFRRTQQRHRSDISEQNSEENVGPLSRSLLSDSEEVSEDKTTDKKVDRDSRGPGPYQQMYNRPGFGTSLRPGFGSNRYYHPSSQETRYFRPITNRVYTDYTFSPQGAFAMAGHRPSYRPRLDDNFDNTIPVVSRRSGQVYQVPFWQNRVPNARQYGPWSASQVQDRYNPEYIINPTEMLSRRNFRYHHSQNIPSQRIPIFGQGYWGGNARDTFVNPWSGSHYQPSYLG